MIPVYLIQALALTVHAYTSSFPGFYLPHTLTRRVLGPCEKAFVL